MLTALLDSNIIIYLFEKQKKYIDFVEGLGEKDVGISIVTYMEVLIGSKNEKEEQMLRTFLDQFEVISINTDVAYKAATWMRQRKQKSLRHSGLSDAIIGQTAFSLGIPLVTNNPKDFSALKGLKTIVP